MHAYFLLYHVISIALGVAAVFATLVLYLKYRLPRLAAFLWTELLVGCIVAAVTLELFLRIAGRVGDWQFWIWGSTNFACCGLSWWLPRTCRRDGAAGSGGRKAERAFGAIAVALAAALAVQYLLFGAGGAGYFVLYALIYAELAAAAAYFAAFALRERLAARADSRLRHYRAGQDFVALATALTLPFFIVTDFFGWLIPGIQERLDPAFTLLPVFWILMSAGVLVGAAREILEAAAAAPPASPEPPALTSLPATEPELEAVAPDAAFVARYGLTKREAEVAPLVLRCLSYERIGERLFISPGTVRSHLVHIYAKTGAQSRLELSALIQAERARAAAAGTGAAAGLRSTAPPST